MAGQGAARGDREGAGGRMRHRARLLTARLRYGKAPTDLAGIARNSTILKGSRLHMVKPEWGTKRSCPKCATRLRSREGQSRHLHRMRHRVGTRTDSQVEAADAVRAAEERRRAQEGRQGSFGRRRQ